MTTYTINPEHNGIEITFTDKPAEEIRATLKESGFRWHRKKALWYAKTTPERLALAEALGATESAHKYTEEIKAEKPAKEKRNKYGVKVGDIFRMSWGYEQTNADFFQVVELVGKQSIRIVEVAPPMIAEDPTCSMAADRTYKITGELLPPVEKSLFIEDQKRGDLKRLKSYAADGISNPEINMTSYANAYLIQSDTVTTYESWYY